MKLKDKVAVVTGASGGIGKAIVSLFINEKAIVYGVDVNEQELNSLANQLANINLKPVKMDITNHKEIIELVDEIEKNHGKVDILVNNAGITRDKLIIKMSEEDWDTVLNVNLKAAFLLSREVSRIMIKNRSGTIINISSVIAFMGGYGQTNYASSKAGLLGLTRALAKELAGRNIRVNAILPGFIETPMTAKLKDDVKTEYLRRIPVGRFGKPEDVAQAVLFLASDESSYITGNFLYVDGGLSFS